MCVSSKACSKFSKTAYIGRAWKMKNIPKILTINEGVRMFSHQDDVSIAKAIVFKAHPFCSAIFHLSLLLRLFASTRAFHPIEA